MAGISTIHIFGIWLGSEKELKQFHNDLNNLISNIKLDRNQINFLAFHKIKKSTYAVIVTVLFGFVLKGVLNNGKEFLLLYI